MSIKGVFKKAGMLGLGVLFGAAVLDFTGYNWFDRKGENVLCDLDPTCRSLTAGEVELASLVFADEIDYSRVKIFNRPYMGPVGHAFGGTMAPNGNIYVSAEHSRRADYSKDHSKHNHFGHEMTHVWQYQTGHNLIWEALKLMVKTGFRYKDAYDYALNEQQDFSKLGIEQQAEVVEDYINNQSIPDCRGATQYERILRPHLPLKEIEACQQPLRGWFI